MNKTILITGASGFIGAHVAALLGRNYKVIAPVRSASLSRTNVQNLKKQGIIIVEGDFYREEVLEELFTYKVDFVIHMAAIRGEKEISPDLYHKINVDATDKLLDYSRMKKVSKFIYCSTVGVLGTIPKNKPARQVDEANPDSHYHQSKWEAENLVREYHSASFQTCILRPTITYGKGDDGFVPKLISLVQNNRFIFPIKPVSIHMLNVESFANLCHLVLENNLLDGKSYPVADEEPVQLSDLVNSISFEVNGKPYPKYFRLPKFIFNLALGLLDLTGKKQLLISVKLIRKDWTYDISDTKTNLGYIPEDTLKSITALIKIYK